MLQHLPTVSVYNISTFLTEEEIVAWRSSSKTMQKKLGDIKDVEIRVLKKRVFVVERCLKLVTSMKEPRIFNNFSNPEGDVFSPWRQLPVSSIRLDQTGNSILNRMMKRKHEKELLKEYKQIEMDLKLVKHMSQGVNQDYYTSLRDHSSILALLNSNSLHNSQPRVPEQAQSTEDARDMLGFKFCPVKYLKSIKSKLF